ncbi:MAG: toxin secretion, membrane fusion protein [Chloroflexi bacterium]|nr:toxin secretion, membrane fusion protein [Chloroflexota bacterium]
MKRSIVAVVTKTKLDQRKNDFAYWQAQPYEARIAALEEIRRDYHAWADSQCENSTDVQPGFQRVYRIVKR